MYVLFVMFSSGRDDDDDDDDDDVICSTYGVTPDRVNRPKVISHTLNV